MGIKIIGTGSYLPERILTNRDLEKMVDTSDEWIRTRTGISERRISADNEPSSELALKASLKAIEMAKLKPEDLDLIVVATITQDRITPSTACILQNKLGAFNAACFDLQAACTGFLYSLEIVNALMSTNPKYKHALIIGVEKLSMITDWKDRNTCVLFGDGAGAVILEKRTGKHDIGGILASRLASNGSFNELIKVPAGGSEIPTSAETIKKRMHFLSMEGQEVFKLAVNEMAKACQDVLATAKVDISEVRWLIPHQANLRIIKAVGNKLEIPEEKVYINVHKYGNTSAASVVIALDEIVRSGKLDRGDYVLLTAFGAGITWGANLLRW
ncbi:MAG TPA: 3-oxoacyl-ACP synthase [Lentisphaeria bacterium]|nr:MAG: 3-oxoacyl-ACP synthase [Lentisphaerae bacterium GWF2_50_93]HCE46887.1 3-oxoacyl-ACP synthase [Lentisphaeria bacterium]